MGRKLCILTLLSVGIKRDWIDICRFVSCLFVCLDHEMKEGKRSKLIRYRSYRRKEIVYRHKILQSNRRDKFFFRFSTPTRPHPICERYTFPSFKILQNKLMNSITA